MARLNPKELAPVSVKEFKVLVLGLDGATLDLMLPWIEQGDLPALGKLLLEGSHSRLRSTTPPITPCAWSSFMTGKNPGKHGLFDFVEPVPGSHGFRFTNASSRHGESLWGILSRAEKKVGVMNVPMTYPPEQVNGYLISGLDTPHEHSPFMYPDELKQELKSQGIRYRIDQQHLGNMRSDARRQNQLDQIWNVEQDRTSAFCYLSKAYPADFRMIVYGATDQVQHHFWHYMDPNHDKYDRAGAKQFSDAIRQTYIQIDRMIESILADCDDDTVVVVMSDHGFGPTSSVRLRLNQVLEEQQLLSFIEQKSAGHVKRILAGLVDRCLRATLSSDMKRTIAGMFPNLRVWFENLDEAEIDWEQTTAYVNEAYRSSPAIWLNQRAELSDEQSQKLLRQIEDVLSLLIDPRTKQPLISHVYRTRDLYHGPFTDAAPELLPSWWEDGFLLEQSVPGVPRDLQVERSSAAIQGGVEFAGSHRLDGVFMMAGGPTRKDFQFSGADIMDVAPTVLYLMGQPVPSDMDGRVLEECLDPEFVAGNPIRYKDCADQSVDDNAESRQEFTEDESALIAQRLQALGYIK